MPYHREGTKIVKSDSGEVVKDFKTVEAAIKKLVALNINVVQKEKK